MSGYVAGGRVDRIRSGVRDLFQGADHQHSFPLINPNASKHLRRTNTHSRRTSRRLCTRTTLSATVQVAGSTQTGCSARGGLKRARLVARSSSSSTRKGVGIVVVVVVVSLGPLLRSFTFTEVFPRRRLKHADQRLMEDGLSSMRDANVMWNIYCPSDRKLTCVFALGN